MLIIFHCLLFFQGLLAFRNFSYQNIDWFLIKEYFVNGDFELEEWNIIGKKSPKIIQQI